MTLGYDQTNRSWSELADSCTAHNYHPQQVVITSAEGAWVTDVEQNRYLDCLAGYSALNFGHRHPRLLAAVQEQLQRVTLTSRGVYNDELARYAQALTTLCGKDLVLPMNTGAEAVETAIKVARRWGYEVKGVPDDQASVIVMDGNFHGRTTTIVSFSTDPVATHHYAPFTPGFQVVPFADPVALEEAIGPTTVAVLLEPIQGEAGVIIPPEGYLRQVREITERHQVLMIADEIQSGLCRTGATFACDHEGVVPDLYLLAKTLGGGFLPVSAVMGNRDPLAVVTPGSHGSTFGGNPLAARIGREVVAMVAEGVFQQRALEIGTLLREGLTPLVGQGLTAVRVRGGWAGIDVDPDLMTARDLCTRLLDHQVLAKDAHGSAVRFAPPLVATDAEIDLLVTAIGTVVRGG